MTQRRQKKRNRRKDSSKKLSTTAKASQAYRLDSISQKARRASQKLWEEHSSQNPYDLLKYLRNETFKQGEKNSFIDS